MAQAQYGTLITNIGLAKIANAQVTQSKVGLENIALGDGKGAHYVPTQNQTALVNEVWRGPVADVSIDPKNNNRITVKAVIPVTVGGFTIREIGVFDNEGFLIAVGQYPEKYKPQLIEGVAEETIIHFVIETNNANVVKLNIDPTVIIASQEYVDKKLNYLDSRIGDTSKLETDYKKDTVGAVNEIQHELNVIVENLGFHEPISAALERGTNEINAPVKTLCSLTGLEGRTIINYAPLFDGGAWTINTNATVTAPNTIVVKATDIFQQSRYNGVPLKPGGTYRLYYEVYGPNNNVYVNVEFRDASDKAIGFGQSKTPDQTFTVPPLTTRVDIYVTSETNTGVYTIKNVMLIEAQETKLPFVSNIQGITNPTIENIRDNLIPAFNYGGAYHVPGWMYLKVIDHTGASWENNENARVLVPVAPGTKYTFSCIRKGMVSITGNDGSSADDAQHTNIFTESVEQDSPMNCTFTVPAGINFIRILFMTTEGGYVTSPMLVKGATPSKYKPQVHEALTIKTTLYTGESLKIDPVGQLVKTKKYETVHLENVSAKYVGMQKGLHLVDIDLGLIGNDIPATLVKFNGALCKQLAYTTGNNGADTFYLDSRLATDAGGQLRIAIADTDSGWGPKYQPTPAEIKAYFMGWRMYNGTLDPVEAQALYNDTTHTKAWRYLDFRKGDVVSGATTVLPTTNGFLTGRCQPYLLHYLLKTPLSEVVATTGSLALDEGENILVVSEGRIVQEVAKPYHYQANAAGVSYDRYEINTRNKNPLDFNTSNILQVYKNGKPDNAWEIQVIPITGYPVRALLDANLFDPAAVYTVDYMPQEPYRLSVPTNAVTIEYADNLGGVIQSLLTTAAKLGAQASNLHNNQSFRLGYDEGGLYIAGKGDI
ncbi:phage tail protein [Lysinibacillus irui]|uniref:phage tail protein n=1 Tax=Lysinibacillus irui TaxID=2998077 RepID=UPI002AD31732|nr:phage tail protein [Lysinibacillus irui]MEA0565039.1 phage tail protein [Lysinibacillus irui]